MSLTYIGIIVTVLGAILPKLGISIGTDELTTTVSVLITLGGAVVGLYGRYRAGGISALGFKS